MIHSFCAITHIILRLGTLKTKHSVENDYNDFERFDLKGYYISKWNMIVRVSVVTVNNSPVQDYSYSTYLLKK